MDEERIAVFLDYENLAIGVREAAKGGRFDFEPIANALAERGRVVSRRAYADWSMFLEARDALMKGQVELIEIPQRKGLVRKNAADIKMAVDAVETAFERDYVTTFVVCTGDSDFTPLVHKLRELNKRVIGVGVKGSTSALLPPACDEFLFYDNLEGVDLHAGPQEAPTEDTEPEDRGAKPDLEALVTTTLSGLLRSSEGEVLASSLKRAILRKDPTFSETDHGFRAFGELLRHLEETGVIEMSEGPGRGDPVVQFASGSGEQEAFSVLHDVVGSLSGRGGPVVLSGLKNQMRKRLPGFSEKKFGFGGFLQFCKAAAARGLIELDWDEEVGDYRVVAK
jgi:uncharacterized LabA/DUF88 family protein